MSFFRIENLSYKYSDKPILDGIDLIADRGKIIGILGENGCGKTTLLKCITGSLKGDGDCIINIKGEDVSLCSLRPRDLARHIAYMPQTSGIALEMTTLEACLMAFNARLKLLENPSVGMESAAKEMLKAVGLEDETASSFLKLSQGQKQRCIFARTLLTEAELILLDEPESAIDFDGRYYIFDMLKEYVSSLKADRAAIVTIHDATLALNYCDEVLLLKEGHIIGSINSETDSNEDMSKLLSRVYGGLQVVSVKASDGREHIAVVPVRRS